MNSPRMDYRPFLEKLAQSEALAEWAAQLPAQIAKGLNPKRYGDLPRWQTALDSLPTLTPDTRHLNRSRVGAEGAADEASRQILTDA